MIYYRDKNFNPEEHEYCRGRIFSFDEDATEDMKVMFFDEFLKTQVETEIEAYTFSRIFGACQHKISKNLNTREDVLKTIKHVSDHLKSLGIEESNQVILIRSGICTLSPFEDDIPEQAIVSFKPSDVFYTDIILNDGVSPGQEMGGYIPAENAEQINILGFDIFMTKRKCAVNRVDKEDGSVILELGVDIELDSDKTDSIIAYTEPIK